MSRNIWLISDHHLSHSRILTFKDDQGNLIRPGFKDVEHMNEIIIDNHNKLVKPEDKVYFGGDVAFGPKQDWPKLFSRFNGKLRLILGNHDHTDINRYKPWFQKIMSWRQFGDMPIPFVFCHYALHSGSFNYRKLRFCVHGHLHDKLVKNDDGKLDWRYLNVCCEHTDYRPLNMDEIQTELKRREKMI